MGLSYHVYLVHGFRVKFEDLFEVVAVKSAPSCLHTLPSGALYCPTCGRKAQDRTWEDLRCKIPGMELDFEDWDYCFAGGEISLVRGRGDRGRDYVLGSLLASEDVRGPQLRFVQCPSFSKNEILEGVARLPVAIPFDEYSFGIYLLFSTY